MLYRTVDAVLSPQSNVSADFLRSLDVTVDQDLNRSPESPDLPVLWDLVRKKRYPEALQLAQTLSEKGIVEGDTMLGWLYQWGQGTKQDFDEAERWYNRAARAGGPVGYFYLASLYRQKDDGKRMLEYLEVAAEARFAPALYELGRVYYFGLPVPIDRTKAFRYFAEAAKEGHWFAQVDIAKEMLSGRMGLRRVPLGLLEVVRLAWCAVFRLSRLPDRADPRVLKW